MAKQTNGILICALGLMLLAGCASSEENKNTTATTTVSPPIVKELTVVPRPQTIEELMKQRGEQDQAQAHSARDRARKQFDYQWLHRRSEVGI